MSQQYLVIIQRASHNFAAYSSHLPGCVAAGRTKEEPLTHMREDIAFHLSGLQEYGQPIPAPTSTAQYLAV